MPAERLAALVAAGVTGDTQVETAYGQDTLDVPPASWHDAVLAARDSGLTFFDWLTAVDQLDLAEEPGLDVVTHLWSVPRREHLLVRTRVPATDLTLATVTDVFAGASWHERETYEMFGLVFEGHPHLVPLLLPDGFEGYPLRKDFVLAARVAKSWPGAKDPGESDADVAAPSRRKTRPPGVPDPQSWGPRPASRPDAAPPPAASAADASVEDAT